MYFSINTAFFGGFFVKFQEMFLRRAEKGQCFHQPYLGCREFAADFTLVRQEEPLPPAILHLQQAMQDRNMRHPDGVAEIQLDGVRFQLLQECRLFVKKWSSASLET